MKKKILLLLCLAFAGLMVGAGLLYNNLAAEVQPGALVTTPPETEVPTESTAPPETEVADETTEPDYSAPDFTMLDKDGNTVKLSDFVGKPILLNFWASWCGPCQSEMPHIQKFYEQYGEAVHFLIINCTDGSRETVDTAKAFMEEAGYTFPVYFDTTSYGAYAYGASSIPLTYFIDADGNLLAYYRGAMNENILQQGMELLCTPQETE